LRHTRRTYPFNLEDAQSEVRILGYHHGSSLLIIHRYIPRRLGWICPEPKSLRVSIFVHLFSSRAVLIWF
jgi:hypothetical protein